jgi:hypothetical protein
MKTENAIALTDYQNPFALARYAANVKTLANAETAYAHTSQDLPVELRSVLGNADTRTATRRGLAMALAGARYLLEIERAKPCAVRAMGQTSGGQDDSWRVWVVLSREVSASLLTLSDESENGYSSEFDNACAELWERWGMSARASGCDYDYSPSGQMFSRGLSARRVRGAGSYVILSQSGSRDV